MLFEIFCLPLVIVAFLVVRIIPRTIFSNNDYLGTDQWFHFYLARSYRELGFFRNGSWPRVDTSPPPLFYPPLFHLLISRVPSTALLRWSPYITPLVQFIELVVLGMFSYHLASMVSPGIELKIACLTCLIIAFLPILFGPNSGMVFSSPRPLGVLLANTGLASMYFFSQGWAPLLFIPLLIMSVILASLTSRFAVQALLFIGTIYSALTWNPGAWLILAGSYLIPIIAGYSLFLPLCRNHLRHIILYKLVFEKKSDYMTAKHQGTPSVLVRALNALIHLKWREASEVLYSSALMRIILMNPLAVFVVVGGAVFINEMPQALRDLFILLVSVLTITTLTAWRPLKFLGDAERYIEFGALLPIAFLTVWYALSSSTMAVIAILLMIYSIVFCFFSFRLHPRIDHDSLIELLAQLESLGQKKILAIPTYCHPMLLYLTDKKVPYLDGWQYSDRYYSQIESLKSRHAYLYGNYPGPNLDTLDEQICEFDIDCILFCTREKVPYPAEVVGERLKKYPLIFSNGSYELYQAR